VSVVAYDPTRDKRYQQTRLGRDVVDFLAWLELGGAASRTLDQYERDLSRGALMFPAKGVEDFEGGDLLHVARAFKPAERRVRMAAYRSFFKWARQMRRIIENPTEELPPMRRQPQKVIEVFTDAEVEALLSLDVVDAAPLAVLFEAGLRKAEARALQLPPLLPRIRSRRRHPRQGRQGPDHSDVRRGCARCSLTWRWSRG
jgi:integrase